MASESKLYSEDLNFWEQASLADEGNRRGFGPRERLANTASADDMDTSSRLVEVGMAPAGEEGGRLLLPLP